ncbi:MAG: cobalamin-binding protein [Chloroflexi bacterium]|nr:cobalamin-binding protein [Chloroflexota bacterium]
MKKPLLCLVLAALIISIIAGCAPATTQTSTPTASSSSSTVSFPLSLTDDAGRTVRIEKSPQRIVSLAPSNTEILFALGLGDKVVGVDEYSDYPAEAKTKAKVGSFSKINLEKVVSLAPDLILATNIHVKTIVPELEKRGLTVVVLQPQNIEAVLNNIALVGKLSGKTKEAAALTADIQKRLTNIATKTKTASSRPRVFLELSPDLITIGPGTFIDDLISRAGGENIAAEAKTAWPQLNQETIVLKDPQVILLADHPAGETPEKVKSRPGWQNISAVKNGRIVVLNPDLVNRPGPRVIEGLEMMAKAIHPELFK